MFFPPPPPPPPPLLCMGVVYIHIYRMDQFKLHRGELRYGDGERNVVDVFTVSPYKFERDMFRNSEARVVMFVHGGAFIIGDKSDHRAFADTVLRILVEDSKQDTRNVCVAIPNYTLSSTMGLR